MFTAIRRVLYSTEQHSPGTLYAAKQVHSVMHNAMKEEYILNYIFVVAVDVLF